MKLALASDLHFGSVPEGLADTLAAAIENQKPDLVVIAGDLTLGARSAEFDQAKAWLAGIKPPSIVIPGNHDLPYWNLLQRFADPFHRYRLASGSETLMPTFSGNDAFVLGFNTTVSWQPHFQWQEGVARRTDIAAAKVALTKAGDVFKVVAGHHPFVRIAEMPRARPVRRAEVALQAFAESGTSLVMSGHTHLSFAVETVVAGRPMIAIGAPTALSWRTRGEPNGFWTVDIFHREVVCDLWLRDGETFKPASQRVFDRPQSYGSS